MSRDALVDWFMHGSFRCVVVQGRCEMSMGGTGGWLFQISLAHKSRDNQAHKRIVCITPRISYIAFEAMMF